MSAPIEFQLFAPYNKGAALMGSFSNWEEIPMAKDEEGYFRTRVELEDGVYQYKFRVQSKSWFLEADQWVDVVDPCATDIDDPTQNGAIRIKDGDRIVDTYVWQHDDKPLPADRELVIYEMHVADFSGGEADPLARGKYEHVVEKLDYLVELGVNAIELMPLKEYPGDYSWGYNPRYFFAAESSYGTTEQLKNLIDECHGRGIRVIIDGIYNHSESSSPLTQIDHDYWYHHAPRDPDNNWGPEFNYEFYDENLGTYPARKFIGDTVRYWIQEYHLDGIRFDAARQIANYDFMHWIVQEAKNAAGPKPFYTVAEYIPETPSITNIDGPMDGCWHDSFYHCIVEHICGDTFDLERLKDAIDCKRQGFLGATNVVNYLSNHDHDRVFSELGDRGILDEPAFKRAKLGSVLLMTAVGVPLIWMGEEFGEYKAKTIEQAKIDWTLLGNDMNKGLWEYYKGLIHLRKNNQALYTENIDFFHEDPDSKVFAYTRWNDEGSRVVVVANLSENYLAGYSVPHFPANGTWHEWTGNYDVESGDDNITIDLPEYEAKVFVWQ
ncbi:MAG: alpha amylase C-terminal domain-containing protein [Microcoleus sp. PH2017_29_MFU_D_A]|uniref:alpha-amylase family glycosyl hydrolase n=1 Tax=unclassified Microcoleus TaxID=2642155 RepID=UPI001DD7A42F|nr:MULTISPECIES: alpha-amylase family glycosyl hydrolase [unclassified Microcoleus]MCC3442304.1 alpha amylase C-terminal domain-containing protein [Microcoleus sp. PH2017_03_ELD_O_A]MCC3505355.1 alpha amylase C-terminal domain-containing protein [Microcoleus sp. PH2017_19_SFW_U_A]TAE12861.1 MAG: alpha-amylase [Oscillatoriales cyanobacterium]MCC3424125.1 alpha amylase C-terminal domain-containing protein [Microcoleus sp. PH2017_01_SCD_O_A]MCC3449442.1 alpha amylase C-terminal domain-containing 